MFDQQRGAGPGSLSVAPPSIIPPLSAISADAAPDGAANGASAANGKSARSVAAPAVGTAEVLVREGAGALTAVIESDPRQNAVIIYDAPEKMPIYEGLIRQLDAFQPQIQIEAMILDIDIDAVDLLGVAWQAGGGAARFGFGDTTTSQATILSVDTGSFFARVNALATKGRARVLGRPTVLTLDNLVAVMSLSETIYARVGELRGDRGGTNSALVPISTGTLLRVIPRLVDHGDRRSVSLIVEIQDGQFKDREGRGDSLPIVSESVVNTQAMIGESDSLLIGGYFMESDSTEESGVPGLNKVPLLGGLFRDQAHTTLAQRALVPDPSARGGGALGGVRHRPETVMQSKGAALRPDSATPRHLSPTHGRAVRCPTRVHCLPARRMGRRSGRSHHVSQESRCRSATSHHEVATAAAESMMVHSIALRYFAEVARTGSLAAASQSLHVATSAVSRHVAQLEKQIGVILFERMPRGMVLTKAGAMLAEHARRTLLEGNAVLAEISTLHARSRSLVRIGADDSFTVSFLPAVMAEFHRKQSGARFIVRSGSPDSIEQWVETGEVDLGLSYAPHRSRAVETVFTMRVPAEALCRVGHPLARRTSVSLDELMAYALAVPERDTTVRRLFESRCGTDGSVFQPLLVSDNAAVISQFVSLTDGVAVGNRAMLNGLLEDWGLVAIRIVDEPVLDARHLQVITMQGRRLPSAVRLFVDALKGALGTGESTPRASRNVPVMAVRGNRSWP